MAVQKCKNNILEKITSVDEQFLMEDWYTKYYFDDWDDDTYDYYYDWEYDVYNSVDYHKHYEPTDYILLSKSRGITRKISKLKLGCMIDLDTIYDKATLRNRKINQLLGLDNSYRPTLEDLFKKL